MEVRILPDGRTVFVGPDGYMMDVIETLQNQQEECKQVKEQPKDE